MSTRKGLLLICVSTLLLHVVHIIEQSTKIIQMAEMCRKLETEEEKVLPFFARSLTSDEEEQVASVENEETFEDLSRVSVKGQ